MVPHAPRLGGKGTPAHKIRSRAKPCGDGTSDYVSLLLMRIFHFVFLIFLLPVALPAADFTPTIRREASKCASAWQRSDYEGIISYLPPRVIQQMGGRAAVLRELKAQFAEAREYGVERMQATLGQPSTPKQFGQWLTSLIPLTAVLHRSHLDLTQQTHALGLSSDQGKHWFFVLLHDATQAEMNLWFPEFKGKLMVPVDPAPELEVVL